MAIRIMSLFAKMLMASSLMASSWLLLANQQIGQVVCDYPSKSQYPSMDDKYQTHYRSYDDNNSGGGYNDNSGYNSGEEERPKIKLNFGVHVPAMKIHLPRLSLPKITIRAKVRQPNKPSTINVPEINLETQSKVEPPGSKSASNGDYGNYNGGYNDGQDGNSYDKPAGPLSYEKTYNNNYKPANGDYDNDNHHHIYSGTTKSSGGYSPAPVYHSTKKQQQSSNNNYKHYNAADNNYNSNNYKGNQDSTYLSASNDYRDGTTSLSVSNQGQDDAGYAASNKKEYTTNDFNRLNYDNGLNNNLQVNSQMLNRPIPNSDNLFDNHKSGSASMAAFAANNNNNNQFSTIGHNALLNGHRDSGSNNDNNKYRVSSDSILLNFPERFNSNQQTYMLDKSRSSSMIEPHPTNDMISKPVHLVYSAIAPQQFVVNNDHWPHLNANTNLVPNANNINNNIRQHPGQESRTSFIQKISSPFLQMKSWLRPHNRQR